ncbi:integral membrane protein GPR180-like [Saccoglossus kowalevskii]|uniref:Transmembrane protein 145-like n=1 Tax=Saccoglossus kowalevskii TaxID=10224 RepID=A0ABM0GX21_SACKO|nr:PREDICTED: transmembrane protein 145-like [Saccoglossus kowalevskii]
MAARRRRNFSLANKHSVHAAVSTLFVLCLCFGHPCYAKHVKGKYKTDEFYKFITKFAFQETDPEERIATAGYIFGNITLESSGIIESDLKFVALDQEYWADYSEQVNILPERQACIDMFRYIGKVAYDRKCLQNATLDLTRTVPCPKRGLCLDEYGRSKGRDVIPGYQFTIRVEDFKSPRFWYLSMVSCYQNWTSKGAKQCTWYHMPHHDIYINYDIWLVNGNPLDDNNLLFYQFSFTMQGILGLYLAFAILYIPLLLCHTVAHAKQMHAIVKVFTLCMYIQFASIILIFIHLILYSQDGVGIDAILQLGNVLDMATQCLFMLLLLLIAKGWTITTMVITQKRFMLIVWAIYCLLYGILFIWQMVAVDPTSDLNEYQSWPGALILSLRCIILVWFLMELRSTCKQEYVEAKLRFYRWFGVGYSIWFIYLPLTVLIISQTSALWRQRTVSAMMLTADFISNIVMAFLFWPTRSSVYFKLGSAGDENRALLEKYSHLFESI